MKLIVPWKVIFNDSRFSNKIESIFLLLHLKILVFNSRNKHIQHIQLMLFGIILFELDYIN